MTVAFVEKSQTAWPLTVTIVDRATGAGVAGLAPTVAVRDASALGRYLDFGDNTFKTAGWTTKYAVMSAVERGHYARALNVATLPLLPGATFAAEYHVDNGADLVGDDADLFAITRAVEDASITRKYAENEQNYASGNPGSLVVKDDDGTPFRTHELRDEQGNGVLPAQGSPARRTKGV